MPVNPQNEPLPLGPTPPNLLSDQLSLLPPVIQDSTEFGQTFGQVLTEPPSVVSPGDTVLVKFVSYDLMHNNCE